MARCFFLCTVSKPGSQSGKAKVLSPPIRRDCFESFGLEFRTEDLVERGNLVKVDSRWNKWRVASEN